MIRLLMFALTFFSFSAAAQPCDDLRMKTLVFREAFAQDVDPFLIMAVIKVESSCRANARSRAGAVGLMQVMPKVHRRLIRGRPLARPEVNIEVGTAVLKQYLASSRSLGQALRRYSGGAKGYARKIAMAMADQPDRPVLLAQN